MGMPHSTLAIAETRWHIVTLSSYLMGWTGDSPEKAHTVSMYFRVSFSDDGAQVDTIDVTVFFPYRLMYRRRMRNAALMPYSMVTNSSNSWSVGLFLSPNQVLPILMFRGLLLRIPRGCILAILLVPEVPHTYDRIVRWEPCDLDESMRNGKAMAPYERGVTVEEYGQSDYADRVI